MDTVKKFGAGSNKVTGVGKDAAKLDRETEELHHDRHDGSSCRSEGEVSNASDLLERCSRLVKDLSICRTSLVVYAGCRLELKKKIQQARLEKKLTQAQLGQLINEKPNVSTTPISPVAFPCAPQADAV